MDKWQVRGARLETEKQRKMTENLIAKGTTDDSKSSESIQPFVQLNSELTLQQDLCDQLEQSLLRVEKIKSLLNYSREVTSGTEVATNTFVVKRLMQFLGRDELLTCQLVNRLWNYEIIRLVTETLDFFYFHFCEDDEDVFWYGNLSSPRDLNEIAEERTLRDFHLLLEDSKHPEFLMKEVHISGSTVDGFDAPPINIFECEMILQKYGHHVRKLEIADDKGFNILGRCLGQNGYCPNIEHLTLSIRDDFKDELPVVFEEPFVLNLGSLKLKILTFSYDGKDVSSPQSSLFIVLHRILQNCGGIDQLNIQCKQFYTSDDWKTDRFIQVFQSNSHVMSNLKSFRLEGKILENLHTLAQLPFGANLKMILFQQVGTSSTTKNENEEHFGQFLKLVSPSLEYVCVTGLGLPLDCAGHFPLMPKLKLFMNDGAPPECMGQFLKKLPSLQALGMGGIPSLDELLEHFWKKGEESGSSTDETGDSIVKLVYEGLEEIGVETEAIFSPGTIRDLNVAFPNLCVLQIDPKLGAGVSLEECQTWFEQAFEFISQMNCLKNLNILFRSWECGDLAVNFNKAFTILKKTPNLMVVTFSRLDEDKFKLKLIADALPALLGAQNLRRIVLHCGWVQRNDADFKERLSQMTTDFAESRIHLETE